MNEIPLLTNKTIAPYLEETYDNRDMDEQELLMKNN